MGSTTGSVDRYRGIVFKQAPPTGDFACSKRVVLPGEHTRDGAWAAVHEAMRRDRGCIGGEIELVFAETDAERFAEMLSISEHRSKH